VILNAEKQNTPYLSNMLKKITQFENRTSNVFHKIHSSQNTNQLIKNKIMTLLSCKSLKLKNNYFKNKICADFGCGSTGFGALNLFNLGADFVHLVDLKKNIKKKINNNLKKHLNKFQLHISSIEKTRFKKNSFDFVLAQGVIHHANNDDKCLKEIYRVLKKNSKCLISVTGSGGIITETLIKIIRPLYHKDKKFKKVVNKILFNKMKGYKKFYLSNLDKKSKKIIYFLQKFIDKDIYLTLQDRILAPKYKTYDENELKIKLKKIGFKNIYRIKRNVKFKNLRSLLSPFYHHWDHDLSRLLYGNGFISLMMTK
jgi:ubiquinone/menaquinone biosynthesis C-methylase UbiE